MKIKFSNDERLILAGFLYKTRNGAAQGYYDIEVKKEKGILTEEDYKDKKERLDENVSKIKRLINKFRAKSVFVKLKQKDVREFIKMVEFTIEEHENYKPEYETDKPVLTNETYGICKNLLINLKENYERARSGGKFTE